MLYADMVKFASRTGALYPEVITTYLGRIRGLIVEAMLNGQNKITVDFSLKTYKENLVEEIMDIIKSDGYRVRKIIDCTVIIYEISWGLED